MNILRKNKKRNDKAGKTTRRVKVFLPIGEKLPGGYEPVVFIRKTTDTKGGAK